MAWATRRRGSLSLNGAYLRWRQLTAYGHADEPVTGDDLTAFLEWRRRQRRAGR